MRRPAMQPVRTNMGCWVCPHRGCPDKRAPGSYRFAVKHASEAHYLCSCGRWFTARGLSAHRRAVRWRGIEHSPFPSFAHINPATRYDYCEEPEP